MSLLNCPELLERFSTIADRIKKDIVRDNDVRNGVICWKLDPLAEFDTILDELVLKETDDGLVCGTCVATNASIRSWPDDDTLDAQLDFLEYINKRGYFTEGHGLGDGNFGILFPMYEKLYNNRNPGSSLKQFFEGYEGKTLVYIGDKKSWCTGAEVYKLLKEAKHRVPRYDY